jgi:Xaa-Pro dipeptidase
MHELNRRRLLGGLAVGGAGAALGSLAGCRSPSSPSAPISRAEPSPPAARADAAAELDALFAHLKDQRPTVAAIAPVELRARRARLAGVLRDLDLDALLVEPGPTLSWLTGVGWGKSERLFAFVGAADGSHAWVVPAFEEGRARRAIDAADGPGGEVWTWDEHERPEVILAAQLRERRLERVAVEPQLRWIFADRLCAALGRDRLASGQPVVFALRARKDEHEIAILRRASESTQLAIRAVAQTLRPGLTGDDVAARMAAAHARLGMRSPWALCLVGAAAALPHGDDQDLALDADSCLLVDTGASLHGYQSDTSRTWSCFGPPSAAVERAWHAVRDAQQRAYELVAPGVLARDVDARAREVLVAHGYSGGYRSLTHRLGHGIGMEGHEDPYFDGGSDVVLASGMTLSDEPGIYVVGEYGVRLEDIVMVTESGRDHFGAWPASPRSPG